MADWDENSPEDNDLVSQYPANARAARAAVRGNFGVDHREQNDADVGKHEVIQMVAQAAAPTIAAGQVGIWNEGGNLNSRTGTGGVLRVMRGEPGTSMVFYQASAPTGWTQDTTVNDRVLRVVSGSGGSTGGSWTISGVTVNNHTLTVAQIPSHNHGGTTGNTSPGTNTTGGHSHTVRGRGQNGNSGLRDAGGGFTSTESTNTAGAHSHTVDPHGHSIPSQGGGGGHSHGLTADGAWRPSYIDVIVATLD